MDGVKGTGESEHAERTGPSADALARIYREQYGSLVRMLTLVLRDQGLAEETAQEAFIRLHRAWARGRNPERVESYLRSIALNLARSRFRRMRLARRATIEYPDLQAAAETEALQRESYSELIRAVWSLPNRQRECIALRYFLDLTESEIAQTLGISTGSVKTHLHRAMKKLERGLRGFQ